MSRRAAGRRYEVRDLAQAMRGILFDARRARALLDEIPSAYKDIEVVLRAQRELVHVEAMLAPLLVHKGSG